MGGHDAVGDLLRALRGPDEPHHLVAIDPQSDGPGNVTGHRLADPLWWSVPFGGACVQ